MHNPYYSDPGGGAGVMDFRLRLVRRAGQGLEAALGNSPEEIDAKRKVRQMPYMPMAVSFLSEIVMAAAFSYLLAGLGVVDVIAGAVIGLMLGVCFMALSGLVNNMFAGRKLMLAVIDGAHWIGVAVIQGAVVLARQLR